MENVDRIVTMSTEELQEELRVNTAHIESLQTTITKIENELYWRKYPNLREALRVDRGVDPSKTGG